MEKYHRKARIKPLKEGNRVYVRYMPKSGIDKNLQPKYEGPCRIINEVSDVVVRMWKIGTGKEETVHTDKVKILLEDGISVIENPDVRRAYPTMQNEVLGKDELIFWDRGSKNEGEESELVKEVSTEEIVEQSSRYNLRSSSQVPDMPHVMPKLIEYRRRGS